jgi:imidazole glycerol-phosphate synthase
MTSNNVVHLLDYGAGNVRSVRNAIRKVGFEVVDITCAADIDNARVLVFPGVGAFASAMAVLREKGYVEALRAYIGANRPFLGVCLGLQLLFESSDESPGVAGLGIIKGSVDQFPAEVGGARLSVPHIGWNGVHVRKPSVLFPGADGGGAVHADSFYFVHSFCVAATAANAEWTLATTNYGPAPPAANVEFVAAVQRGRVMACQFHPEKSGAAGLRLLQSFLGAALAEAGLPASVPAATARRDDGAVGGGAQTQLSNRVIACLDVRSNDAGDLIVTKGDQYDVRESAPAPAAPPAPAPADADADADAPPTAAPAAEGMAAGGVATASSTWNDGGVRNLGKPVELAARYFDEGADEVVFLNICSFRNSPLADFPLVALLESASARVFVPLTIGGGIRDYVDDTGAKHSALDVAAAYFRAGADKVSIGSDAVMSAEAHWALPDATGKAWVGDACSIGQIATVYGRQAVVVSIDPRCVFLADGEAPPPMGEGVPPPTLVERDGRRCWFQATVKGGREGRPIDAVALAVAVEALGCGEIMLNCIDADGSNSGFCCPLIKAVKDAVGIPVIASSGAGAPEHFEEVFRATACDAALAAGIFHRREVSIEDVKGHLAAAGLPVRQV